MNKWTERFLETAKHFSKWSKDPSTRVGAVIVDHQRRIVGIGYNGFPRGVHDHVGRYQHREVKYQYVVHAEVNAILNANSSVEGCTIYTYPMTTCNECAKLVIQSGISHVVSIQDWNVEERWQKSFEITKTMYAESGITLELYDRGGKKWEQ